jgi:hypothetical protein
MPKWSERPYRTRLLGSVLLLVVFGAGGLVGAATSALLKSNDRVAGSDLPAQPSGDRNRARGPRGLRMDSLIFDEIAASPQQRAAINAILDDRDRIMRRQWNAWESRFDTLMIETRGQVRAQLSADQVRKLDQALAERAARRRARQNDQDKHPPQPDSQKTRLS